MAALQPALPSRHRNVRGPMKVIFLVFSGIALVAGILYIFYIPFFGMTFSGNGYLYFLIALYLPLSFLAFPAVASDFHKIKWYDYSFAVVSFISALFMFHNSLNMLSLGWEFLAPTHARILSLLLLLSALEAARRTGGTAFFCVCLFFGAFPLFADHFPAFLKGKSFSFWRVISYHGMGPESLVGIPMRSVGTLLFGYMVFAVALVHTGAGDFFLKLAMSLFGHVRGGTAKVAIVSSAMMGSVSGSALSNVVTTGSFTIPAMKKSGYPPYYAGAIEACASTGGVLMPPIMGVVAFVMAEILGVPYLTIIKAAILPSILYFYCLFSQADFFAAAQGLRGIPKKDCPSFVKTIKEGWFYFAAIFILIIIVVWWMRESQAPWISMVLLFATAMTRKSTRITVKKFLDFIEGSGKYMCELTSILTACGLIIGSMGFTGVAQSFAHEIVMFSGGNEFFLLLLGALASFIMGMGMTITACYIFLAIVLAPALIRIGLDTLAVHLYVMYWGMASYITPPVALAAFSAATIAGSSPMKTGFQSMKLGMAKYFLPFFFVYNPALIGHASAFMVLSSFISCLLGITFISWAMEGYMIGLGSLESFWKRPFILAGGILLGIPGFLTDLIGIVIILAIITTIVFPKIFQNCSYKNRRQ